MAFIYSRFRGRPEIHFEFDGRCRPRWRRQFPMTRLDWRTFYLPVFFRAESNLGRFHPRWLCGGCFAVAAGRCGGVFACSERFVRYRENRFRYIARPGRCHEPVAGHHENRRERRFDPAFRACAGAFLSPRFSRYSGRSSGQRQHRDECQCQYAGAGQCGDAARSQGDARVAGDQSAEGYGEQPDDHVPGAQHGGHHADPDLGDRHSPEHCAQAGAGRLQCGRYLSADAARDFRLVFAPA